VRLLDTAVELLNSYSVDQLTIALILEQSGVSYGSLYHHFNDISNLVEQAVVHRYTRRVKESNDSIRLLLDSTDAVEFRTRAEALFAESISVDRSINRLQRVEALGFIQGRPRLASRIAQAQQELTEDFADILSAFQRKDWIRSDIDPIATASFIQSLVIGRVIDDVSDQPVGHERWCALALPAFRAVLFAD
jgi:AcrR family transcriptional regulator